MFNCNKNPKFCLKLLTYRLIPQFIKNDLFYQLGMYSQIKEKPSSFLEIIKEIYLNNNIEIIKKNFFNLNLKEQKQLLKIISSINPYLALKYYEKLKMNDNLKNALILYCENKNLYNDKKPDSKMLFNLYNFYLKNSKKNKKSQFNKLLKNDELKIILKKELNIEKLNLNKPFYIDNIKELDIKEKSLKETTKEITIIITVYNEEKLILHSLESIINQIYKNLRIIIVDDFSTDKTLDVSRGTFEKNNFTNYLIIRNLQNYGTYISRNIALKYVQSEYIGFQDADDYSFSTRIEQQIELMENNNKIASYCNLLRIKENGEIFSKNIYPLSRMAHISMIVKKDVISKIGYFKNDRIGNDSEYFERIKTFIDKNATIKLNKVLLLAAQRKNSLTTHKNTGVEEFGINSLRINLWEKWREEHLNNIKNNKYYIDFNEKDYEYEILHNK